MTGGEGWDFIDGGFGNDSISGGPTNDELWGVPGDDSIFGGDGPDRLWRGRRDTLRGGSGNDILDGGGGVDTAVFDGNRADYTLTGLPDGRSIVTEIATGDTDVLFNVESLAFVDITIPFDGIL